VPIYTKATPRKWTWAWYWATTRFEGTPGHYFLQNSFAISGSCLCEQKKDDTHTGVASLDNEDMYDYHSMGATTKKLRQR